MLYLKNVVCVVAMLFPTFVWGAGDIFIPEGDVKIVRVYIAPSLVGKDRDRLIDKLRALKLEKEVTPVTRDQHSFPGTCTFGQDTGKKTLECWNFRHGGYLESVPLKSLKEGIEILRAFSAQCYNPIRIIPIVLSQ